MLHKLLEQVNVTTRHPLPSPNYVVQTQFRFILNPSILDLVETTVANFCKFLNTTSIMLNWPFFEVDKTFNNSIIIFYPHREYFIHIQTFELCPRTNHIMFNQPLQQVDAIMYCHPLFSHQLCSSYMKWVHYECNEQGHDEFV